MQLVLLQEQTPGWTRIERKKNHCRIMTFCPVKHKQGTKVESWILIHIRQAYTAAAQKTITTNRQSFVGSTQACNLKIHGTAGKFSVNWKCTWQFDIEDDNGGRRTVKFPNIIYCKGAPYSFLSPSLE